jgi:SAM-dependent methyltransferase
MNTNKINQNSKADYGQDMTGLILIASIIAIALLSVTYWQCSLYMTNHANQKLIISIIFALVSAFFVFIAGVGVWSSRLGKLKLRDKIFSQLNFTGNEKVLDLGCGNGLLLIAAAKRIPEGKAVGADHWVATMEYKYSSQMCQDNAAIEGVSDRTEVVTADAQSLPFADNSFDLVMTSLMMHHVPDTKKALYEMVRVLRPGGTLVIADVNSKRYVPVLISLGMKHIDIRFGTRLFLIPSFIIKGVKS